MFSGMKLHAAAPEIGVETDSFMTEHEREMMWQAAILMAQAARAKQNVSAVMNGTGDRDAALDEVRTYMTILSISAPVLIDARVSRTFLEQAQRLAAELARGLASGAKASGETGAASDSRLEDSFGRLRSAAAPLQEMLTAEQQSAARGGESQ